MEALPPGVKALYAFGSFARREVCSDSDVDLIAVCDTERPFLDRAEMFSKLYEVVCPLDLLVYTPPEFEGQLNREGSSFWCELRQEMRRLV